MLPMDPTMYGRLTIAMTTAVSSRPRTPDGDDGDNELLELGTDSYTEVVPAPQGGRLW
jgi:hypothetical protein